MITCHAKYVIDTDQLQAFELYCRLKISVVTRLGGQHHGYFLPVGDSNIAYGVFSFANLAEYDRYCKELELDEAWVRMKALCMQASFILEYDRAFLQPIFS